MICNVDQQCKAFFNVTIGSGGTDFVTPGQVPITIDSLTLGASTGRSTLVIGSSAGSTLTIGDINAPVVAPAEVTVNSTELLTVNPGSALNLNIQAGNGAVTNNGTIALNSASGSGANLLIHDGGNTHQLTLNGAGATISVNGSYTQDSGSTGVEGTLIASSIAVARGTMTSGDGIIETKMLTNGAAVSADSTRVIGVGSGPFTATTGYQQLTDGTLDELISSSTNFGTINVTGGAALDGVLNVTLENGFIPTTGEQFAFLNFIPGDLSGLFAGFLGQTFGNGMEKWALDYNNAGGELTLTAEANTTTNTPEPASLLLTGPGLLCMMGLWIKRRRLGHRG